MRILTIIGLSVLGIILVLGIVAYIAVPNMLANAFLHPNRQPMVKNPGDYGMEYEDVRIETEDGVTLAGWLIRGTGDNVVIIGHPGTFTKYGYALEAENAMARSGYDRDVEFGPVAKHLVDAGYTVLMYDQRNHGESGSSPDGIHSPPAAYYDTLAVTRFMAEHPDFKGQDIGLLSYCQSSFVSMVAMSKNPEALQESGVKAFVAVQPIAIEVFYRNVLPGWVVDRMQNIYDDMGLTMDAQDPLNYAGNVFVPTLFVQNINDPWSDMDHIEEIYNLIPTEKEALWLDTEDHHRFMTYNWFNDHPEKLLAWFERYL